MSAPIRSVALLLLGAAVALGVRGLAVGGSPQDARGDLLRELADRQEAAFAAIAGAASAGERTVRDVQMSQFYRLQEFRRLGTEGQVFAWVVPVPEGREGDPVDVAMTGGSVRLPRIVLDPTARDIWSREVARLADHGGTIDARIFEAYVEVRAFVDEHPWPSATGLAGLRGSEWASPDVTERWLSLNRALVARVDALLSGL